MYKAMLNLFIN
jgi:hypothetical protein